MDVNPNVAGSVSSTPTAPATPEPLAGSQGPSSVNAGATDVNLNQPPATVPYDRFKEVNDKYRTLEDALPGRIDEGVKESLYRLSQQHPDLAKVLFGQGDISQDATPLPQIAQPQGQQPPQTANPLDAKVDYLFRQQRQQEHESQLHMVAQRIEDSMTRHDVFKDAENAALGSDLIATAIAQNPNLPMDFVVKDVAGRINRILEHTKSTYMAGKAQAAGQTPVNTGGGLAPTSNPPKIKMGDGSGARALAAAISAANAG